MRLQVNEGEGSAQQMQKPLKVELHNTWHPLSFHALRASDISNNCFSKSVIEFLQGKFEECVAWLDSIVLVHRRHEYVSQRGFRDYSYSPTSSGPKIGSPTWPTDRLGSITTAKVSDFTKKRTYELDCAVPWNRHRAGSLISSSDPCHIDREHLRKIILIK